MKKLVLQENGKTLNEYFLIEEWQKTLVREFMSRYNERFARRGEAHPRTAPKQKQASLSWQKRRLEGKRSFGGTVPVSPAML